QGPGSEQRDAPGGKQEMHRAVSKQTVGPLAAIRSTIGGQSLSRPDAQVFQSRCWRLSVASDGARLFDNGNVFGVRWEAQRHTPFLCSTSRLRGSSLKQADNFEVSPDWCSAKAKVASKSASRCACPRNPKKM